jgi:hypothetical protein
MHVPIPSEDLPQLRELEKQLRDAVGCGRAREAKRLAKKIQVLFKDNRRHHRLLRAKLWAFEACLDANDLSFAQRGFIGVRKLAGEQTRLYLEATAFLGISYLRQKKIEKAKPLVRETVRKSGIIRSEQKRQQFHKRFVERIEEECILAQLIGDSEVRLDPQQIHDNAVSLLKEKNDHEITLLIGQLVPEKGVQLLREVREYSVAQLPPPSQKLLPPPNTAELPIILGSKTLAVLRRIGWRSLCDPDSTLYKAWAERLPEVFSAGYFASAVVTTFASWKIGIPLLASGIVAIVMKYSAHEFCAWAKPEGLMIASADKS